MKRIGSGATLTRRELLEAAALTAAGAVLVTPAVLAAEDRGSRAASTVVVTTDGRGDFGPDTAGTRTSGIQEAIEAAHAAGGGVVLLRGGVYLVDNVMPPPREAGKLGCGPASLQLYDDITLRGEGMDRTIVRVGAKCNTNTMLAWESSRISIEDLTLDGAGLNAGYGIAIFGMKDAFAEVCLQRVKATGFGGSAIAVAGGRRVMIEQCVGINSKIGFEMGAPSEDYLVLHCTAYGCWNGTLGFNSADQFNEAGNLRPRVIGGLYDGEAKASGVALWDCFEAMVVGVVARRGVTTNIQISSSHRKTITTPVGGGLIEACVAEGSVASKAGRYGVGACQDGVRVVGCTIAGNEDVGVLAAPGKGGMVAVHQCTFRAGQREAQRYAIRAEGQQLALRASGNLYEGPEGGFIANPEALVVPGSLLSENSGFNPVGLVRAPQVPSSGDFAVNVHPYAVQIYLHSGGLIKAIKRDLRGATAEVGRSPNVSVALQPGEAIGVEYHARPRWSWFGG